MPRIKLYAKRYAKNDFQAWIRNEMKKTKMTCEQMGKLIGVSGSQFSRKLAAMEFNYDQLVSILGTLNCPADQTIYFMTGQLVKEVN